MPDAVRHDPRPTIFDVARRSGVSKSTVSRAVSGHAAVAPETRRAVLEAAVQIGYRVNPAARTLRTSRSALVGLLVPAINHAVFAEIAEQLETSLRRHDVALAVSGSGWDRAAELAALEVFVSRDVDALVVAVSDDRDAQVAHWLAGVQTPVLLLDRELPGLSADAVLTDQQPGTRAAVLHLAGHGHRRIGLLSVPYTIRPGREAARAHAAALREAELRDDPALRQEARPGREPEAVAALLAAGATAIIVGGATAAVARVLEDLQRRGLTMPRDVSLVAYDDSDLAALATPRLTTIVRPVPEIGSRAGGLVAARLADRDRPPRTETVATRLVVRGSTGPPPRSAG